MATNKTSEWLSNRRDEIATAEYSDDCQTAIEDFLDAYDPDNLRLKPPIKDGKDSREDTHSTSSRLAYASVLHRTAQHLDLTTCSARELNQLANEQLSGSCDWVKDEGLSQNTVHQNQIAWRSFSRFHKNHPQGTNIKVDPDEIILVDRDETKVDERDMFESEEIEAMRQATQNKRDRALLEMLIYTGQRHNALRMLKYKDVRPDKGESGIIYLPDDSDGLKGAEGKRPLLGAQKAARDWRQSHPTKDPDDAFFTHTYDWSGHDTIEAGDHLSRQAFGRIPKRIADRAGVEKPTNPHQFRHYFVTMSIRNHGMSMDTVRHLIGHAAGSRELERTYQHLVDDDHIENAEQDMGLREQREETLTPTTCPVCDEPLEPHYSVCPNGCVTFSPDAKNIVNEIDERETQGALHATSEREKQDLKVLMDLLDDPDVLNQLIALSNAISGEDDVFEAFGG